MKVEKAFAPFGEFETKPLVDVAKPIRKLLAPQRLEEDVFFDDDPIETAFVHKGNVRVEQLTVKGKKPAVYVIDGNVDATEYLEFLCSEHAIVHVTKNLTTKFLRIGFATTLLVGGNLTTEEIIYDSFGGASVGGKTKANHIFLYDDLVDPKFGKQPKGVVVDIFEHDEVVLGDVEAHILFKRMITGRRFLK